MHRLALLLTFLLLLAAGTSPAWAWSWSPQYNWQKDHEYQALTEYDKVYSVYDDAELYLRGEGYEFTTKLLVPDAGTDAPFGYEDTMAVVEFDTGIAEFHHYTWQETVNFYDCQQQAGCQVDYDEMEAAATALHETLHLVADPDAEDEGLVEAVSVDHLKDFINEYAGGGSIADDYLPAYEEEVRDWQDGTTAPERERILQS